MKYTNIYENVQTGAFDNGLKNYMHLIYKNMGIALSISGIVAFIVAHSPVLLNIIFRSSFIALIIGLSPLFVMFSFNKTLHNGTVQQARSKLFLIASLMGLSLSSIFVIYTKDQIFQTFLTTAITFGCMSLYGYSTKRDLTSLGSFLFMGVLGLFMASLVNLFLRSSGVSFITSCIGVVIFTLYTAYDVQNLKKLYNYVGIDGEAKDKIAIMGALCLYIDFVNLFMDLLRILNSSNRE